MGITLAELMGAVVLASGCLFIYLWIKEEGNLHGGGYLDEKEVFRCPICAFIYVIDAGEELSSCPRCSTINESDDA